MGHLPGTPDSHSTPGLDFQAGSLTVREALGILETIRSCRRCGSPGPWGISKGEIFQEVSLRAESGRIASFSRSQSVSESQQEANARFVAEVGNHADWILQAVHYALNHGFRP